MVERGDPMKRLISIMVALLLLFPFSGALSQSSTYSAPLTAAVKAYLDSQNYTYDFDSEYGSFDYGLLLESSLSTCDVRISMREDGFSVFAFSPISGKASDMEGMRRISEYLTRANYSMIMGNYEMDFADGDILFRTAVMTGDRIPSTTEIEWLVELPGLMLDEYGNGLAQVVLMKADPKTAFEAVEGADPVLSPL
jgi:hypothetical protein